MWGRITNIATQMDTSFGNDDRGANGATGESAALTADADDEEDNVSGWGDDDFDDDLDFGDDPIENGMNADSNGETKGPPLGEQQQTLLEEEASLINNIKANEGVNGVPLGEQQTLLGEGSSCLNGKTVSDQGVEGLDAKTEEDLLINTSEEYLPDPDPTAIEDVSSGADKVTENTDKQESQGTEEAGRPPLPQSAPQLYDLPDTVTVSAPGKALVAGGYLVLESPNPGVVLAADGCRFHATVAFRPPHSEGDGTVGDPAYAAHESIPLDVYSPQFDRVYSYHLSYSMASNDNEEAFLRLRPRTGHRESNAFVERSLLLALGYLRQSMGAVSFDARLRRRGVHDRGEQAALAVKLRADNDFYSQIARLNEMGWDLTPQNLNRLEPFLPCPKDESTGELVVNKTGMGSSAALVTSMVGALLQFFGVISLPSSVDSQREGVESNNIINDVVGRDREGLRIAHNLSQICHCHAQGKVGSGFDVSSAIYGSHVYTRFSKGVIANLLERMALTSKGEENGHKLSETLLEQLVALVDGTEWDCTVSPVSLPPGLELLMADVCGGSESPSMARKVLEWKKNKRKLGFMDDYFWKDLKRCNNKIVSLMSKQLVDQTFLDGLQRDGAMIISTRTAQQWKKPMPSSWHKFEGSSWDVALKLFDLRMTFLECRQNLKGMGNSADVPIEPDEQSALADATMKLPGVVAAGVPGAGGYDALFVIYVKGPETDEGNSDHVRDEIGKLWNEMSSANDKTVVCPLSVRAAGSGNGLRTSKLDW